MSCGCKKKTVTPPPAPPVKVTIKEGGNKDARDQDALIREITGKLREINNR